MRELELTTEEFELLSQELTNFQYGRLKEIRNGMLILLISAIGTVILWFLTEQLPIANKLMAITISGTVLGAYKSYWWYNNLSIKKLQQDIQHRIKFQDESTIKSYRKRTHTVKLSNGFRMNDFDIQQQNWKVGDNIVYEYTPTDKYILNTQILAKTTSQQVL
ncbi:MAG: hypothetical protein RIC80_03430 [Cyclobacteriaceae bacterium]